MLEVILGVVWVLAALLTVKLDNVFTESEINVWDVVLSLFLWWFIAILLLTTKHKIVRGDKVYWSIK